MSSPAERPASASAGTAQKRAEETITIVMSGPSGSGKTSLSQAWSSMGAWPRAAVSTIGVEFATKTLVLPHYGAVHVRVWDTSGQERFHSLTPSYYRGADVVLLAHDGSGAGFERALDPFLRDLRSVQPGPGGADPLVVVVATKADTWCSCAAGSDDAGETWGRGCVCAVMTDARAFAQSISAAAVERTSREQPLSCREPFRAAADLACARRSAARLTANPARIVDLAAGRPAPTAPPSGCC